MILFTFLRVSSGVALNSPQGLLPLFLILLFILFSRELYKRKSELMILNLMNTRNDFISLSHFLKVLINCLRCHLLETFREK